MATELYTPNFKRWDQTSPLQPNVEISEGIRPAEKLAPAAYLNLVRYDNWFKDFFVIQAGKIVALDSAGHVVPSGLALQAALYQTAFEDNANADTVGACKTAARAVAGLDLYNATDLSSGVLNFAGVLVTPGEAVVESFFTMGNPAVNLSAALDATAFADGDSLTQVNVISKPIGIAPYNYWKWAGGDGSNPTQYTFHNFNQQHAVAVLADYYIEMPVVLDTNYALAPLTGIAAAIYSAGSPFTPGCFVKADLHSNFVMADPANDSYFDIIGQVWKVDTTFPKDYLDRVRTAYTQLTALDRTPGSATGGLPDNIFFANGSAQEGVVRINLIGH